MLAGKSFAADIHCCCTGSGNDAEKYRPRRSGNNHKLGALRGHLLLVALMYCVGLPANVTRTAFRHLLCDCQKLLRGRYSGACAFNVDLTLACAVPPN